MAIAFGDPRHALYQNAAMLDGIVNGLSFWYTRKPVSDNWWYNDIGQQLELGPTLIMMEAHLSDALVDTGCTYLNDPQTTGQNLVWYATQTVQRGCLQESLADINSGLDAIKGEVRITTEEGIQRDLSFHQHGPQLYNGGYGRGFVNDVSYWVYMARGLSFAFSADKIGILSDLILGGTQWMVRRGNLDFACQGREISRPNNGQGSTFTGALDRMMGLQTG
jgi:chondroitin AC lyase